MSSIPVPPPLPDPILLSNSDWRLNKFIIKADSIKPEELTRTLLEKENIIKGNDESSIINLYNSAPSVTQEGPVCGLVASIMALESIGVETPDLNDLLIKAKERGYTYNGEMFSVSNLCKLLEETSKVNGMIVGDIVSKAGQFVDHISRGWPILIPYDADHNHQPCCKLGYRSHWAVLLGYCLLKPSSTENSKRILNQCKKDEVCPFLYHVRPSQRLSLVEQNIETDRMFVYAKQGKSFNLHLFKFDALVKSNCNLTSVNPKEVRDYLLPEDGVAGGLSNQALFIKPKL